MKKFRNLFVAVLALFAALAIAVPAFAAGTGSITITPPEDVDDDVTITYTIYKVFDADGNGDAISYKLVDGKTTAPDGFTVDTAGNVTYTGTGADGELTDEDIAAIAAYVASDSPVATVTSTGGADAVAKDLPNGYYYITTTTGTVVTIDSTNPDAEVKDKNIVPSVDKVISDASSYDKDGKKALAQVGTEVEYTVTITVGKGQVGYVLKDTLSTGLEYVDGSLSVTGMAAGTDYTLTVEGQNITVKFEDATVAKLTEGTEIVVTYSATVTSDALQDDPANNTATISYGKDGQYTSEPAEAEVYNAKITVTKQDGDGKPLAGAGFVLQNSEGKYYKLENGVVSWVESIDEATEYTSDATGTVTAFTGLADGEYTLVEKTVPAGYNKAEDSTITIEKGDYTADNLEQAKTVINQAGSVLPSTGGMGTTVLYIVGTACVLGGVVFLITKKRVQA